MDTRQLEYFVQVCKSKSITKAAQILYISQQGLSASIARLEKELNCTLLVRTSKGIVPTAQGRCLLPYAEQMLNCNVDLKQHLESMSHDKYRLQITCAYGVIVQLLDEVIFGFKKDHPEIMLIISEFPDLQCEAAVENEEAELGFSLGPINDEIFNAVLLHEQPYWLVAHKSHPLAKMSMIRTADLENYPLLLMNDQFRSHHNIKKLFDLKGIKPQIFNEAAEASLVYRLTEKNYGVAFSAEFLTRVFKGSDITAIPFEDSSLVWDVNLFAKKNAYLSRAARTFIRYLTKHISGVSKSAIEAFFGTH